MEDFMMCRVDYVSVHKNLMSHCNVDYQKASDLIQMVMEEILNRKAKFTGGTESNFPGFVFKIARRIYSDLEEKRMREVKWQKNIVSSQDKHETNLFYGELDGSKIIQENEGWLLDNIENIGLSDIEITIILNRFDGKNLKETSEELVDNGQKTSYDYVRQVSSKLPKKIRKIIYEMHPNFKSERISKNSPL